MKNDKKRDRFIIFLTIAVIFLTGYYLIKGNLEYVYYGLLTLFISLPFTNYVSKKINSPRLLLYGLGILILINLCAGGIIYVNGKILYEWVPIELYSYSSEFTIIKFDQIVHAYGAFMCTMIAYYFIKTKSAKNKYNHPVFALCLLLIGFGAASFYEIIEFLAKVFEYNAVGEYYNTLLDLCFNFTGALIGLIIATKDYKRDL